MEPDRETESRLLAVQAELMALEPIFHGPRWARDRASFESMTDEAFWEVGASGRRYSREEVFRVFSSRGSAHDEPALIPSEFYCQELAPDNFLLTYTLAQGPRVTRRATLWRRAGGAWRVVYHQGTPVDGA